MSKTAFLCIALLGLGTVAASARHHSAPAQPAPMLAVTPYQRVKIADLERVPPSSRLQVIGYFSHKSPELDGDLEVYLIDRHGYFVIAEAPLRCKPMKRYIRSLHLHRGELVVVTGALTQQKDKPTSHYKNGWMEINPIETIARYAGPKPADLHYVRVIHHLFGRAHTTQM